MGLSIAFSIIKRHGGFINVDSTPGKGSTFALYLPASEAPVSMEQPKVPYLVKGTGKILVMDDESYMQKFYHEVLELLGYEVLISRNGQEAIDFFEAAEKKKEPFKLIFLDLTIKGGMGGREVVEEIRKIRPDAVVIAASGYSNDPIMSEPLNHGFNASLVKPFLIEDLSRLLSRLTSSQGNSPQKEMKT